MLVTWRPGPDGRLPRDYGEGVELPVLDAVDQRILGALLEKQRTVPATYPLTLNSLRLACNQTSSREPVVDYDEPTLEAALKELRQRGLIRVVWADTGRRTLKYHQLLDELLGLQPDERALITVLLLRGPQSAGELKTRTDRLHGFADRGEVEACLTRLAELPTPLVQELERRAGQHDTRWVHLLGPVEAAPAAAAVGPVQVDRESLLSQGAAARDERVMRSYDAVAEAYAEAYAAEFAALPFDDWFLGRLVGLAGDGPVLDAGCGPGHAVARMSELGGQASGIDFSPGMVAEAARRFPEAAVAVGDLRNLLRPTTAAGWSGILARYSLIHLAASEWAEVLAGFARVLVPGGVLGIAVQLGDQVRENTDWLGQEVSLPLVQHDPEWVREQLTAAGLGDLEWYRRGPQPGTPERSERGYFLARRLS